jgi:hypothetical protein
MIKLIIGHRDEEEYAFLIRQKITIIYIYYLVIPALNTLNAALSASVSVSVGGK